MKFFRKFLLMCSGYFFWLSKICVLRYRDAARVTTRCCTCCIAYRQISRRVAVVSGLYYLTLCRAVFSWILLYFVYIKAKEYESSNILSNIIYTDALFPATAWGADL